MEDIKLQLFKAQKEQKNADAALKEKEDNLKKIQIEIKDKPHLAMEVSDHAILMYNKRVLKEDYTTRVTEMLNLCDNAELIDSRNKGEGKIEHRYETDGPGNTVVTLIVVDNKIVTCYENEKENGKQA